MIKRLLFAVLFTLSLSAYGQDFPIDKSTGRIVYTDVIEAEGSKDELYNRAKEWIVDNFRSIDHVLEVDSKQSSQIIGKGATRIEGEMDFFGFKSNALIGFTFKLNFKDGRYKYEFSDLRVKGLPDDGTDMPYEDIFFQEPNPKATKLAKKNHEKYKQSTHEMLTALEASLKTKMAEESW